MEVQTVDEQDVSLPQVLLYLGVVGLFLAVVTLPVLFSVSYVRVLKTVLLVLILGMVGRLLLYSVFAFVSCQEPPAVPESTDLPLVSVVIPAYNEAEVLPDTIAACRALDYPAERLEVVLCYEADCDDETPAICERAAAEHPEFVAVERDEAGGGKAAAANYGVEHATGEVIASIDADHQFEPDAVRRAVRWFHAEPETACVKGRCYGRNPTDSIVALHATVDRHINEKVDIYPREVFSGFTIFGGGQAFFRSTVFETYGGFDEDILIEDVDMSARMHRDGERIRLDPGIVTYEEQPTTVSAWWNQRKRWARGWMQVSVRHFKALVAGTRPSLTTKFDAAQTFAYSLIPAFLVAGFPIPLIDLLSTRVTAYIPGSQMLWWSLGLFPALTAAFVFVQDYRDGLSHHPREYLAAITLGPYMLVNTLVYVVAFIDEFVLDRDAVYVTTTRAEDGDD